MSDENDPTWSDADREQFASLERRWTDRAKFVLTVPKLIAAWSRFVVTVEDGYSHLIEEYCNELDSRDLLQEAVDQVASDTSQRLRGVLEPWDRRFKAATVPSEPPVWRGGWWAERIPKVLVGTEPPRDSWRLHSLRGWSHVNEAQGSALSG